MREIKFRVWDKIIPKSLREAGENKPSGNMVNWDYVKKSSYLIDGLNGKFPIMQFTGLLDKNGKEIYEGDIIQNSFPDGTIDSDYCVGEVIWDEELQGFMISFKVTQNDGNFRIEKESFIDFGDDFFVIGNIFEKGEKE